MWIESHVELERHPKFLKLMRLTKWSKTDAMGRLHLFWYWCAQYAPNGDLRPYGMLTVNDIFLLPARSTVVIGCKFVDDHPYLRVHDWWDYFGRFLQIKYKNRPEKWLEIKASYVSKLEHPKNPLRTEKDCFKPQDLTNQPTKTLTTKEMAVRQESAPTPCPKGATARPRKKNGHIKNCACEICWKEVTGGA